MELKTYFAQDRAGNLIPSAVVSIYLTGTTTLASGLTTVSGSPLANPFSADADGKIQFRAPDGIYDMQVSLGSTTGVKVTFQCVDVEQQLSDANSAADRAEEAAASVEDMRDDITALHGRVDKIDQADFNNLVVDFGAVPDYTGTPLYDGNDTTRVTATDNTPMLLNALTNGVVKNDVLHIHVPAGHFGFSGDKIILDPATLPYKKLVISGEGEGVTILDYIKEDNTGTGNTEQGDNAKELLRLETGFKHVEFQNITLKCTTKTGFVNGTPSSDPGNWAAYHGTIWFAHIKQAEKVVLRSVTVERGNYRGLSIDGISDTSPGVTELEMRDCTGRYNTGSGFWLRGIKSAHVFNCDGYRNGNKGITATGYGITFSQYCANIVIEGGAYYENYRKGIDKHGGVGTVVIKDVLVADNIVFQMSFDHQYNSKYDSSLLTNMELINVDVLFGLNSAFCDEAIAAIDPAYANHITILLNDKNIDGTTAGRLSKVTMTNCKIGFLSGLANKYQSYNGISSMAGELRLHNFVMDLRFLNIDKATTKTVYSLVPIVIGKDASTLAISGKSELLLGDGKVLDQSSVSSNAVFCTMQANARIIADDVSFDLQNYVLFGLTGSGLVAPWVGERKINNCTLKIRDLQTFCFSKTVSPAIDFLRSNYFFKPASYQGYGFSNKIGLGDCKALLDYKVGINAEPGRFKIPMTGISAGSTVTVLTGNLYGNLQIDLQGMTSHATEKYQAWWDGSTNIHRVITGATVISATPALSDYTVQYNGANTNFILKAITVNFSGTLYSNSMFNGTLTAREDDVLAFAGIIK